MMKLSFSLLCIAALCLMVFAPSVEAQSSFDECVQSSSLCTPGSVCACRNGGTCVAPDNNTCTCNTNTTYYAGFYCETPKCTLLGPKECNTGTCVSANVCNCTTPGWEGIDCSEPVCQEDCVNGNCTGPDTCTCDFGWAGTLCETAENECERAAGFKPCDARTNCTNLAPSEGGYRCTDCPANFTGSSYIFYNVSQNGTTYVVSGGCVPIGATSTLPSVFSTSNAPSNAPSSSNPTASSSRSSTFSTASSSSSASAGTSSSTAASSSTGSSGSSRSSSSGSGQSSSSSSGTFTFTLTGSTIVEVSSSSMVMASTMVVASLALLL